MRKFLIAASLIAGMSGLVATGVAHADAFNGQAQRSIASNQGVAPAAPAYTPSDQAAVPGNGLNGLSNGGNGPWGGVVTYSNGHAVQ